MAGEHVNKVVMNGNTLVDLTSDTVSPSTLVLGETAHDRSGASITGQFYPTFITADHSQYTPPVSPCLVLDTTDGVLYRESSGTYTAVIANPSLMSANQRGGAKLGNGLAVDANEFLNVTPATTSAIGGVKVDGTTITADNDGTIHGASAYTLPTMDASTKGGAKLGSGLAVDANDVLSVDTASVKSSIVTGQALAPASVTATGAIQGSSISDGTGTLAELRESVSKVSFPSNRISSVSFSHNNADKAAAVSLASSSGNTWSLWIDTESNSLNVEAVINGVSYNKRANLV